MPTPLRPWTLEILRLVEAGTSDEEEVIRLATPFVPQGHAWRTREAYRLKSAAAVERKLNGARVRERHLRPITPAEIHRIGARMVIRAALRQLAESGRVIRDRGRVWPGSPSHRCGCMSNEEVEP